MTKTRTKKKEENKVNYGLKSVGVIRIFSKEKEIKGYSITDYWTNISRRDENGDWINSPLKVYFGKDAEVPEHNSLIGIEDSNLFLSGKGNFKQIALFVREWDYVE